MLQQWYGDHQDLHSFPTRRSSDLIVPLISHSSNSARSSVIVGTMRLSSRSHVDRAKSGSKAETWKYSSTSTVKWCRIRSSYGESNSLTTDNGWDMQGEI